MAQRSGKSWIPKHAGDRDRHVLEKATQEFRVMHEQGLKLGDMGQTSAELKKVQTPLYRATGIVAKIITESTEDTLQEQIDFNFSGVCQVHRHV